MRYEFGRLIFGGRLYTEGLIFGILRYISFRGRSLKMAVFSTRNLLTSTLLAFANKAARRNLDTFHQ